MPHKQTILIAIGGGEMAETKEALDEILRYLERRRDPRVAVMTVATNESEDAARKYDTLFRKIGIKHVDIDEFKVIGEGVVTVVDGSQMKYSDLPYRKNEETIGMFGVDVHVLPAGYSYNIKDREPVTPKLTKMAGGEGDI